MTDRPILFSGPMVRALLAGSKTQTRRVVKPQPDWLPEVRSTRIEGPFVWPIGAVGQQCGAPLTKLPYGAAGDRLWVRETASAVELDDGQDGVRYIADGAFRPIENTAHAATRWLKMHTYGGHSGDRFGPLVPSIHMPRWASRLTLKITEVRVERLQDISAEDADAECFGGDYPDRVLPEVFPPREGGWGHLSLPDCYGRLWEHINGAGSWEANPFVWAVSFEVVR